MSIKEEQLTCVTKKFSKLSKWKMTITRTDISYLQEENHKQWLVLVKRHLPKTFQNHIPRCLKLKHIDRLVVETCEDKHDTDIQNIGFCFDVTSIVEQYIVSILLARSTINPDTPLKLIQMRILQSVMHPITQEYFSQEELDFFLRVYSESQISNLETPFSRIVSKIRLLTSVINAPVIGEFIGVETRFAANMVSHFAFWTERLTYKPKIETMADFTSALHRSIALLDKHEQSKSKTLLQIAHEFDLDNVMKDVIDKYNLSKEIQSSIRSFFEILLHIMPLVGSILHENYFWIHFTSLLEDLFSGLLGPAEKMFGIMFKLIPFKQIYLTSIRDTRFVPNIYQQNESLEKLRETIWHMWEKSENTFDLENKETNIKTIRILFRKVFIEYIEEHFEKLTKNSDKDIYFQVCLMFDLDVVKVKNGRKLKHSYLERTKRSQFVYVLYK